MKCLHDACRPMVLIGWFFLVFAVPGQASESGWMGVYIQEVEQAEAQAQNLPRSDHAKVTRTVDGAPAGPAGIRAGDVIVSVDGEIVSQQRFLDKVAAYSPGETVTVGISRGGVNREIDVTLTSQAAWRRESGETLGKEGTFFVSFDMVQSPQEVGGSKPFPVGLSFGGTAYLDDQSAISGGLGFGVIDDKMYTSGGNVDFGLDNYVQVLLKWGSFSKPDSTFYGLVGIESYTFSVDGSSGDSVGEMAVGIGGSRGNPRFNSPNMRFELSFVQDADLDGEIIRLSVLMDI